MEQKIATITSYIAKSKFIKNVTLVASGTAMAQAITIAFSPIITRLYGPDAFGLLGVFVSLLGMLSPVAAFAYPIAIVLPRYDSQAKSIVRLSLGLAIVFSLIIWFLLMFDGKRLLALLDSEAILPYAALLPFAIFFSVCEQVAGQWVIRKKLYAIKARIAVIQTTLNNLLLTGAGFLLPTGAILIVISTAGHVIHALLLWLGICRSSSETGLNVNKVQESSLKQIALEYYDFPAYRAPQVFLNAISQNLPTLMLASFFGPAAAGFYSLGRRVLALPSNIIGQAVGDVFYPHITEAAHRGQNLTRLILKATLALAAVAVIPFSVVIAFGPQLFSVVFGSDWLIAGEYARWLALWLFFVFVNNPTNKALPLLGAQKFHLLYSVNTLFIRILAMVAGCYFFESDLAAIIIFSVSGAIINIVLILIVLSKSKKLENVRFNR
jgi:O-antigen/teichoic acid export membrane protein